MQGRQLRGQAHSAFPGIGGSRGTLGGSPGPGWLFCCGGAGPADPVLTPAPLLGLFLSTRVTDEVFNFLLVWYYCTLTIRESILISNGSR